MRAIIATITTTMGLTLAACGGMICLGLSTSWNSASPRGIHVAGGGKCGPRCFLWFQDVIRSVDGVEVRRARDVYEALADGRRHELGVSSDSSANEESERAHVGPAGLTAYSLVSLDTLNAAPLDARGGAWGHRFPFDELRGEQQWRIPDDLWGTTWMFFARGHASVRDSTLASIAVPIFVDVYAEDPTNVQVVAVPSRIMLVSPYREPPKSSPFWTINLPVYALPLLFVVDCHGVVRWSHDHVLDRRQDFDAVLQDANEFAKLLEAEVAAGDCWLPRAMDRAAARPLSAG
jgi:hypothetical protein